jgi:hypothetical protein
LSYNQYYVTYRHAGPDVAAPLHPMASGLPDLSTIRTFAE